VDWFFEYFEVPKEKRVKLVAYQLKGGASAWWDHVQENQGRVGKQPIQTWERTRRMLRARFLPSDYEQYLFMKYHRCVQGSRSVHDYMAEFLSGSQENITGRAVVEKLELTVEKHPNPYSIGWIKSVGDIRVTERCKVPFSIGKYRDEVYCDVVDMEACHLLFGRPWQYDTDAKHHGKENMYQLVKEGVRYTLVPLSEKPRPEAVPKVEGKAFFIETHSE
ncbi:hypothetical protein CRG98_048239, partial [Punica granatum]